MSDITVKQFVVNVFKNGILQHSNCMKIRKDDVDDVEELKQKIAESAEEQKSFSLTVDDEQTTPIEEKFAELKVDDSASAINMHYDS
ncbi:hypothetical protein EV183_004243 [Coemansia sp. RSA 2336]|nr:hypothetical protein EV183_004243 [Coemansia sp. RSA 2336]